MRIKSILLVFLVIVVIIVSCKDSNINHTTPQQDEPIVEKTIDQKSAKRKEVEHSERVNSIRLQKVLDGALEIAQQNIKVVDFNKEYEQTVDSTYNIATTIKIGFPFTENQKHVIIRNKSPMYITYDIYKTDNDSLKRILHHQIWTMEFVSDSIGDINGDYHKDFIINGYGVNGCCLRALSKVHLNHPEMKTFTNYFRFLNPTFSAKEKVVRGVNYGHSGQTSMYKYIWKNYSIDTLEHVSYEFDNENKKTGKILISKKLYPETEDQIIKKLNTVPEEYHTIYGYDWFTGNIY